ncbi:hypothetical protein BXY82_2105 [Gelidibacter sediminis]|uniref:Uncharacterized protein n=1 Tax=Gelidibacter sediminis TaxID=1608710 RepID=A0A4R7PYJ0_9FLAO|nr:hypothetical protein [Gelidibacter sediminis]TDU40065.1 hypothetical protein BXY82_2105 [Gelidibacter sediminis]
MKNVITVLILLFSSSICAQIPDGVDSPSIKHEADRITNAYDKHLGLTGIQFPLFKNKVADYLKLAQKIKNNNEGREELDALLELQANETLAMSDILTQAQHRVYKRLKSTIQPLKVIKVKED